MKRYVAPALILALAATGCATTRPAGTPTPSAAPATPAAGTQKPAPPAQTQKPAAPGAAAAGAKPPAPPARRSATSKDGTKIVFEVEGTGPMLLMLHGGGQTGRSWAERGYVARLKDKFTVITMDQRGAGESGRPTTPAGYALDKMLEDITAVADAAGAKTFHLWGFGHGATIGRYLAARSDRVISAMLVSTNMGAPLDGTVKAAVAGMKAKWQPIIEAQSAGKLDVAQLSPGDRTAWDDGIASLASFLIALDAYPALEPAEIKAPTLWVVGASDTTAAENMKTYEGKLAGTKVTLKQLAGATYTDTFSRIDLSLAEAETFFKANAGS